MYYKRFIVPKVLAAIGEQFQDVNEELCGIVISIRFQEDILSVSLMTQLQVYSLDLDEEFKR
jgi:hypothetical protein